MAIPRRAELALDQEHGGDRGPDRAALVAELALDQEHDADQLDQEHDGDRAELALDQEHGGDRAELALDRSTAAIARSSVGSLLQGSEPDASSTPLMARSRRTRTRNPETHGS